MGTTDHHLPYPQGQFVQPLPISFSIARNLRTESTQCANVSPTFAPDFGFAGGCQHCFADTARRVTSLSGHRRPPTAPKDTSFTATPKDTSKTIDRDNGIVGTRRPYPTPPYQRISWCTRTLLSTNSRQYGFDVQGGKEQPTPGPAKEPVFRVALTVLESHAACPAPRSARCLGHPAPSCYRIGSWRRRL